MDLEPVFDMRSVCHDLIPEMNAIRDRIPIPHYAMEWSAPIGDRNGTALSLRQYQDEIHRSIDKGVGIAPFIPINMLPIAVQAKYILDLRDRQKNNRTVNGTSTSIGNGRTVLSSSEVTEALRRFVTLQDIHDSDPIKSIVQRTIRDEVQLIQWELNSILRGANYAPPATPPQRKSAHTRRVIYGANSDLREGFCLVWRRIKLQAMKPLVSSTRLKVFPDTEDGSIPIAPLVSSALIENVAKRVLLIGSGHGDIYGFRDQTTGYILADNRQNLSGTIVHLLACSTAELLGPSIVKRGRDSAFAFLGYYSALHVDNPCITEAIVKVDTELDLAILNGGSLEDAKHAFLNSFEKELKMLVKRISRNTPFLDSISTWIEDIKSFRICLQEGISMSFSLFRN